MSESATSDLCEGSEEVITDLLPNKSKAAYQLSYDRFLTWQKEHHATSFSQKVLLAYFTALSKKWKSSTLWSEYSKVAKMLKIKQNLDLGAYRELKTFLKKASVGYKPKKTQILTSQDIERFVNEAPDFEYLATKVAVIFGVLGACRKDELIKVETTHMRTYHESNDTEKSQPILLVHIQDTKTQEKREFTLKGKSYYYYQQYSDLRPDQTPHNRFFINYHKGKCTVQPIGEKRFASMPKDIARFLKLPNSESYTGHAFQQNSATLLAENYGENAVFFKEGTSNQITSLNQLNLPSTSNQDTAFTENPIKIENEQDSETSDNLLSGGNVFAAPLGAEMFHDNKDGFDMYRAPKEETLHSEYMIPDDSTQTQLMATTNDTIKSRIATLYSELVELKQQRRRIQDILDKLFTQEMEKEQELQDLQSRLQP